MAKMMTKAQIVSHLAEKLDLTKAKASSALEEIAKLAAKEARRGFTIPGLGKVVLVNRKARMGRNPQTGAAIKIPAKRVLRFRIAKALKDAVVGGKR